MMKLCTHCDLPIPEEGNVDAVYCSRQCFDEAIDVAIKTASTPESFAELGKYFDDPVLLTRVKRKGCKIRQRICELRDDAEKRVSNIDSYDSNKLILTRTYFQSRADILNDILMLMAPSDSACSCC